MLVISSADVTSDVANKCQMLLCACKQSCVICIESDVHRPTHAAQSSNKSIDVAGNVGLFAERGAAHIAGLQAFAEVLSTKLEGMGGEQNHKWHVSVHAH